MRNGIYIHLWVARWWITEGTGINRSNTFQTLKSPVAVEGFAYGYGALRMMVRTGLLLICGPNILIYHHICACIELLDDNRLELI